MLDYYRSVELWDVIVVCLHSKHPEAFFGAVALLCIPVLVFLLFVLCLLSYLEERRADRNLTRKPPLDS